MPPCRFFLQGRCTRGWRCAFDHQQTQTEVSSSSLRVAATTFVPSSNGALPAPGILFGTPCRFFAKGVCANGDACRYQHIVTAGPPEQETTGETLANQEPTAVTKTGIPPDLTDQVSTSGQYVLEDAITHGSITDLVRLSEEFASCT